MSDFTEQDFIKLTKDKTFAYQVLLLNSIEFLRFSVDSYLKEPKTKDFIISSICYAIEKHLSSKEKYKAIHHIKMEIRPAMLFKWLVKDQNMMIEEFIDDLLNSLQWIENAEEGKIIEREDILVALQIKKGIILKNISYIGFQSSLSDKQIDSLFNQMKKGNYIHQNTDPYHFNAIFKNNLLPNGFEKVKWILLNRKKEPHKSALREFLTLTLGYSPDQKTINNCFTDNKGKEIILSKPKKAEYSNHYKFFEKIMKI